MKHSSTNAQPQLLHHEVYPHQTTTEWVVFIHGAGGNTKTWAYQLEAFTAHYNVLLLDLRDHGQSKNIEPAYSTYHFDMVSADIKAVLDSQGIATAHFVTLSFGSVMIQDFALRHPQVVQRIVIAGGIFKGTWAIRLFTQVARVFNVVLPYHTMYSLFSYLLMPRQRNQKARRLYQMQARRLTPEEYLKWVGLYGEFFRLLRRFYRQRLQSDVLVVMGGEDYIFLAGARAFVKRQQKAQLKVLPHAGHICNIEAPEAFNSLAIHFLTGHHNST